MLLMLMLVLLLLLGPYLSYPAGSVVISPAAVTVLSDPSAAHVGRQHAPRRSPPQALFYERRAQRLKPSRHPVSRRGQDGAQPARQNSGGRERVKSGVENRARTTCRSTVNRRDTHSRASGFRTTRVRLPFSTGSWPWS